MLDLVMAIIRRLSKGQSPFAADKMHLHHRLLQMGHTHRKVVLVLYLWVSVVALGAVSFSIFPASWALIGCAVALLLATVFTFVPVIRRRWAGPSVVRIRVSAAPSGSATDEAAAEAVDDAADERDRS